MRMKYFFKYVAFFTALIAAIALMTACKTETPPPPEQYTREQAKVEIGHNVAIIYSDSAQVRAKVTAPLLQYFNDPAAPRQVFPNGILTYFYDPLTTAVSSELRGRYAVRDEAKRKTFVRDSVVWESLKEGKLETSELIWDEATNIIYTDKFVKIAQPGRQTIYGYGFRTNQDFSEWRIQVPTGAFEVGDFAKDLK